jgi:type II secretory pathway pseudopilin PulG
MSGLEIATIALIGGTAASAGSQMMAAGERSAAAQFESEQYAAQAQAQRTAAVQDEAARRRDLTSNLETIQAIRAGRGVGSGSPTAMAIYDNITDRSEDDIAASKANFAAKADLSRRAAILSERKSSTSLLAGALGAAGTVASAGFRYATPLAGGRGTGLSLTGTGGLY